MKLTRKDCCLQLRYVPVGYVTTEYADGKSLHRKTTSYSIYRDINLSPVSFFFCISKHLTSVKYPLQFRTFPSKSLHNPNKFLSFAVTYLPRFP